MGTDQPPQEVFWSRAVRTLKDPGHERYCQAMMTSSSPTEAYRIAYHKPKAYKPTPKLLAGVRDLPEVELRVQFLQAMKAQQRIEHAALEEAYVIEAIKELHQLALEKDDLSSAAKAIKMAGDAVGIFRERRGPSDEERKTDEQLIERATALLSGNLGELVRAAIDVEGTGKSEAVTLPALPQAN